MMNTSEKNENGCQVEVELQRNSGRTVTREDISLSEQDSRTCWLQCLGWALAIVAGVLSTSRCSAEDTLILEGTEPQIQFKDTSTSQQWYIYGKDDRFAVLDSGSPSFTIAPLARNNALYIKAKNIGFGTSDPQRELHIVGSNAPAIRLEQNTLDGFPAKTWGIEAHDQLFMIHDVTANTRPLKVQTAAPNNTLYLATNGSVGMGTDVPANILTATNLPGRVLNLKSTGAGTAGLARLFVDGAAGGQIHLVHANAPANQRAMRIQNTNGVTYFNSMRDDLNTNLVTAAIAIRHLNGNIGLKVTNPLHPLHLASGAHVTAGGVFTNASSRELKQDIAPITSEQARETVRKLQPVGYRYKEELDEQYVGFIAEDVPELVATKDRKSLAPMDITAVLTKVVQDQDRKLADQDKQLEEQRSINKSLLERLVRLEQKLTE